MANSNNNAPSGSILDQILEKTANVEHSTTTKDTRDSLREVLINQGRREKSIREATITTTHDANWGHAEFVAEVDRWVERMEQLPPTYWQDKDKSYCQFNAKDFKVSFLEHAKENGSDLLKSKLDKGNSQGNHFSRKPARIEIANVRSNIRIERVKELLELATVVGEPIEELREGKPHAITKARSILFKAKANNIYQLFGVLDGALPYSNKSTNTRTRLQMRINIKPWQCRDCFAFGQHQCEGRKCLQCGNKDHTTRDCKSKTKTCINCHRKGHRAKDPSCSKYMHEMAKEIRKIDLPLEFYQDKKLREQLIGYLQYK